MEVTAFIIELSAEVVKGIQGGNECSMMNNGKLRGEGRRDGCAFERVGADAKQQSVHLKARVIVQGNGIVVLLQWLWEWRGSVRREGQARSPTKSERDSAENLIDGADGKQSPP